MECCLPEKIGGFSWEIIFFFHRKYDGELLNLDLHQLQVWIFRFWKLSDLYSRKKVTVFCFFRASRWFKLNAQLPFSHAGVPTSEALGLIQCIHIVVKIFYDYILVSEMSVSEKSSAASSSSSSALTSSSSSSVRDIDPLLKDLNEKKQSFRKNVVSLAAELKEVRGRLASQEQSFAKETLNRKACDFVIRCLLFCFVLFWNVCVQLNLGTIHCSFWSCSIIESFFVWDLLRCLVAEKT